MHSDFKYDFLVVSLRRVAQNTSEQRSRSGLCGGVIRREATETEGLVINKLTNLCIRNNFTGINGIFNCINKLLLIARNAGGRGALENF